MDERILISDCDNVRLDVWLSQKLDDLSRSYIQKLIDEGMIVVNDKKVKSGLKLKAGDEVKVVVPPPVDLDIKAENIDLDIVYEDSDIIVINKPKDMVVHPAAGHYEGTLVNALMKHCGDSLSDINGVIRPGIVHRIDKDTSGLLVVAKNNESHLKLSDDLKSHDIKRVYMALTDGVIKENSGTIDAPIGRHPTDRKKMAVNVKNGRPAVTHFNVVDRFENNTLVRVSLETGRTHQIRVHMSYIGYPITGDTVYGRKKPLYKTDGQVLHATQLELRHPRTNEKMVFEAPIPEYFKNILKLLKKY